MAEGWAKSLCRNELESFSAGTRPQGVNARAVRAMAEVGVDISRAESKALAALARTDFDVVITVCDDAREACPVFLGAKHVLHVGFEDPPRLARDAASEEEAMSHYRRIRDEIGRFVQSLPETLAFRTQSL